MLLARCLTDLDEQKHYYFLIVCYLIISQYSIAYFCKTPLCVHYPIVRKSINLWGEDLFTHTIRKLTWWRQ